MKIIKNFDLKGVVNYGIGGPASFFAEAKSLADLKKALSFAKENKLKHFILGGGTNLLVSDRGFDGLVIRPKFEKIRSGGNTIIAGCGATMADLVGFSEKKGLAGLEWAGGLPGSVGGALRGNAGAFGGEMKDCVKSVLSMDVKTLQMKKRSAKQCAFGYRSSWFKKYDGREIIVEIEFKLSKGDRAAILEKINGNIAYRIKNHPMDYRSIGSTFKNIPLDAAPLKLRQFAKNVIKTDPFPVIPVAYLIAKSGIQGVSAGGAQISAKHPNFIVNVLDAKSSDIENLISLVKHSLNKKYKIIPEEEIIRLD